MKSRKKTGLVLLIVFMAVYGFVPVAANPQTQTQRPPFTPDLSQLGANTTVTASTIASGLNFPYSMAMTSDGSILFGQTSPTTSGGIEGGPSIGSVWLLPKQVDGSFGPPQKVIDNLGGIVTNVRTSPDGLILVDSGAASGRRMFFYNQNYQQIGDVRFSYSNPFWWHSTGTALLVPLGNGIDRIFFIVGSEFDAVPTTGSVSTSGLVTTNLSPDSVYMMSVQFTGNSLQVTDAPRQIAKGLRNPYGLAPDSTGNLIIGDNGQDGQNSHQKGADTLNLIPQSQLGTTVFDFGFPFTYTDFNTGERINPQPGVSTPVAAFIPVADSHGLLQYSEGLSALDFVAPGAMPFVGAQGGAFAGFHGIKNGTGSGNTQNAFLYYDFGSGRYYPIVNAGTGGVGHLNTVLVSGNSLFVADFATAGVVNGSLGEKTGAIYSFIFLTGTTISVTSVTGVYGGTVALSAKLTSAGSGISGQTIAFTLNGTTVGTATTDSDGIATLKDIGISGMTAGSYDSAISATFAGSTKYQGSSGSGQLTISKAQATLTLSGLSQIYDGAAKAVTVTTSPSGLTGVSITYNGSPTSPKNPGRYAVIASLTNGNYVATDATGMLFIETRPTGPILEKWADSTFPIVWRPNTATNANISGTGELVDVFRAGFAAWNNVPTAQISFAEGSTTNVTDAAFDNINLVSVVPTSLGSEISSLTVLYSFGETGVDQFGRTIQFPGQILEADVLFNPRVEFSTDFATPLSKLDLQSLVTHEIGHLLGLDHSGLVSSVMSPTLAAGRNVRVLRTDDVIRVSTRYPAGTFFGSRGSLHGIVRNATGSSVFGAHVVVIDAIGQPVTSTLTAIDGSFEVDGLEPGNYSAYAEPLDGPLLANDVRSLGRVYPGAAAVNNFTTRFATTSTTTTLTITKTAGDNQKENIGNVLPIPLEVTVQDSSGNPVAGISVSFTGTGGGGTVVPFRATTNAQGKARADAYLGTGTVQTFRASIGTGTVTFTATLP